MRANSLNQSSGSTGIRYDWLDETMKRGECTLKQRVACQSQGRGCRTQPNSHPVCVSHGPLLVLCLSCCGEPSGRPHCSLIWLHQRRHTDGANMGRALTRCILLLEAPEDLDAAYSCN